MKCQHFHASVKLYSHYVQRQIVNQYHMECMPTPFVFILLVFKAATLLHTLRKGKFSTPRDTLSCFDSDFEFSTGNKKWNQSQTKSILGCFAIILFSEIILKKKSRF